MINNLGINTVHVDVNKLKELGLRRMEMCLGRLGSYQDRLKKMENDITRAKQENIPFSIHLPMYIDEGFKGDYLDVFFLDPDPIQREISYKLLEDNLIKMQHIQPDYCVLHFSGVYRKIRGPFDKFEQVLNQAFERINALATQYDVKILIEYMGSNIRFSDYNDWILKTAPLSHVGLLTDTGHLYFASLIHHFDYMKALDKLSSASDAFHLWTTKGDGAYNDSEYYQKYHHIIPHIEQVRLEDWAFDTETVFRRVARENKPMIIEASTAYKGRNYFYDGIASIISILEDNITD